jgi:hypothetical protein
MSLGLLGAGGAGVAFLPSDLSNLAFFYDFSDIASLFQDSAATTPVASNSDPIGYATDKSGNGRHFLQTTAGFRLTYKTGVQNGKSGALCNGVDQFLKYATGLAAASMASVSIYVVSVPLSGLTDRGILGIDAAGDAGALYYRYSTTLLPQCFDAEVGSFGGSASAALTTAIASQTTLINSGTTITFRKDSSANGTATGGTPTKNTKVLGAQADPFSGEYFSGHLLWVYGYYVVHTSTEWTRAEAGNRTYWSVL